MCSTRASCPRVLDPLSAAQIDAMTPAQVQEDLHDALFVVDLTGFPCKSKENVLLSRLLWSAYHHGPEVAAVFGMIWRGEGSAETHARSQQLFVQ